MGFLKSLFNRKSSFDDLWDKHENLLKQEFSDRPPSDEDCRMLMEEIRREGHLITSLFERDTLRAILRYWAKYVHKQTGVYPQTDLPAARVIIW